MRTLAPAVEYQTPKASKTPSPPPQNRSGAPEAMDDFAAIRNRQVLDRATPVTTTAHTRDPFAPHLFVRAWRQRSPHHGHPQRAPSRSLRPLTSRLISVQPVLGSELQSFQQLCGAPAAFFCAHAQVAWRVAWRVACFGPLNPLGPSGNKRRCEKKILGSGLPNLAHLRQTQL